MFNKLNNIKKNELVSGSLILFITLLVYNILNYLFHFSMARMLGPADYGVLAVLMSFIYLFGIPSEAIQTIISKYVSKHEKENGKLKYIINKSLKRGFLISLAAFIIYIPLAFFLAGYLEINIWIILLTGLSLFIFFTIPITRGYLQGKKKFKQLGLNLILESMVKLGLAILLVMLSMRVFGAMLGLILGISSAFIVTFFSMKDISQAREIKIKTKGIYSYSIPFFILITTLIVMNSIDIIFARRFFLPEVAGIYAVASMFGKTIFFISSAIGKAMFPLSSESYEAGKKTEQIFRNSLIIVSIIVGFALLIFLFFPSSVLNLFFGVQYLGASGILFLLGLAFSFLALANVFLLYALSRDRAGKIYLLLPLFILIQIAGFYLFHSLLTEFAIAFASINFIFLLTLILIKVLDKKR